MYIFLIVLFVIVSVILMLSILMQSSKGNGLSGTFGGDSSNLFGGRGAATFLSKISTGFAAAFIILSILISIVSAPRGEASSVVRQRADRRVAPAADLPVPQGMETEIPAGSGE